MICIYHSRDLDGWMSAAIVKKWHDEHPDDFISRSPLRLLGWDYGDDIPDLSIYREVIMCDVAFPEEEMVKLVEKQFTWIDHHISAIKEANETSISPWLGIDGIRDVKFAACELTWKHFFPDEEMPEMVRLLGRYDCFGHKGTDEEQKVLEFQHGARAVISNYEEAYKYLYHSCLDGACSVDVVNEIWGYGTGIYKYLCTEAKQTYSKAFPIELIERVNPDLADLGGIIYRKFLCVNQERFNPVNFGIDYHKDGYDGFACFWYKDSKWTFSLYNDNGKVDCSVIAKQYGGGGHAGASGFVTENLENILNK